MQELIPIVQLLGPTGTFALVLAWVVRDFIRSRNGSAPTTKTLQETVVKELKEISGLLRESVKRQEDIWDRLRERAP